MKMGEAGSRLAALLARCGEVSNAECVVYLTAQWLEPMDAIVLPHIKQNLDGKQLIVIKRGHSTAESEIVGATLLVDESQFRETCRELAITRLPMCILLNHPTSSIPPDNLPDENASNIQSLINNMHSSRSVSEWLIPVPSEYAPCDKDTPALVTLREQATQLFEEGDFLAAATQFSRVLLRCASCPKANFNMGVILQMLDEIYFAVEHMLRVVEVDDQDAIAHTVLRTVLYPAEPELVLCGYESIVSQHADHVRAAHSLATLRGEASTASADYVRQVFDHLADTFEEKLVTHLEYRVPWQIVDALHRCHALSPAPSSPFRVVDLGCGTGLCGRLLRPFSTHIAGIDLSPLMLVKTQETGFYDELATSDITPYLSSKPDASLDLIVSADVWIYVGALDVIFPVVAQKLHHGGFFAFSTELLSSGDGFQLASSGRFKHSEAYITTLATSNGFTVHVQDNITVRKESGEAIPGRVYVLQLTYALL